MEIVNIANEKKVFDKNDGRLRELIDEISEEHKSYFGRRKRKKIANAAMELATRAQKVEQLEKYASIYFRLPIVIDQTLSSILDHPYICDGHTYDVAAVYLCGSCTEVKDFLNNPKLLEEVPISSLPWPPKDIDWLIIFEQRVSWPKSYLKEELERRSN